MPTTTMPTILRSMPPDFSSFSGSGTGSGSAGYNASAMAVSPSADSGHQLFHCSPMATALTDLSPLKTSS